MIYWVVFGIVFFAGFAMTVREGLWSNVLLLINILISGLVAYGFYSPLVVYLDQDVTNGQHTYWLDFAVIWGLYMITMLVIRVLMGTISKTRMRFKHPIDSVGGPIAGLLAAWTLAAFALATLHTSPMGKEAFGLDKADANSSVLTSPDVAWLKLVEKMTDPSALGVNDERIITASGFIKNYRGHREKFDKADGLIVKRGS